jgi:hypothetical protein
MYKKKPLPTLYAILPLFKYDSSLLSSGTGQDGSVGIIDERKWYYKIIMFKNNFVKNIHL